MAGVSEADVGAGEARRRATSWCFAVRPTAALLRPRAAMAAFSSETLILDGAVVAGVATDAAAAAAGGGGGGGDSEEAAADEEEVEAELFGVEIEADAAPALFPPFFFFVMGDAYVLTTLTRAVVEQKRHLERPSATARRDSEGERRNR